MKCKLPTFVINKPTRYIGQAHPLAYSYIPDNNSPDNNNTAGDNPDNNKDKKTQMTNKRLHLQFVII
jgi:hypothetical protein